MCRSHHLISQVGWNRYNLTLAEETPNSWPVTVAAVRPCKHLSAAGSAVLVIYAPLLQYLI